MISTTLTGVNPIPLPYVSSKTEEAEGMYELSWFKSSLSQTVEPGDLFDVAKTFSLTRSEIAAKKRRPWFKIGGRSPYLRPLFEDPYRVVEFFLGKEFWPSSTSEYFSFYILRPMYTLSPLDVFSKLYLHHPQNVLVLSNFSTDSQPAIGKVMNNAPSSASEKAALFKSAAPPQAVHIEMEAWQTGILDDGVPALLNVMAEPFIPLLPSDESEPSLKPMLSLTPMDPPLCDPKEGPNTVHTPYPHRGAEAGYMCPSQENIEQGYVKLKSYVIADPLIPVSFDAPNESILSCDAQGLKNTHPIPTQITPPESVPTQKNVQRLTLHKKPPQNITYPGPRRRPRLCECHKHQPRTEP